jgi:hypothetical protein
MDEAQVVGFGTNDGFQTGQLMAKYLGETYVDPTGWRIKKGCEFDWVWNFVSFL